MSEVETTAHFYVENVKVDENNALMYWKKFYKTYTAFHDAVIGKKTHPEMQELADLVSKAWQSIPDLTIKMAFSEKNIEVRRLFFKAIGVTEMFRELKPDLVNKQTLTKDGISWLTNGTEVSSSISDDYELYKIAGDRLFPEETASWRQERASIYAVRCWCSTTKREYWIYVPNEIGRLADALEAIAWTVQLTITNPEYIYRQGDVILAKHSFASQPCAPYHLNKTQYINLLKAES